MSLIQLIYVLTILIIFESIWAQENNIEEKVVFYCNFDNASNSSACDGTFAFNSNGNQVGLFRSIEMKTDIKYDITDYTSLVSSTSSNQSCLIPFYYNSIQNFFCAKTSNKYQCETANKSYSDCNLGYFLGSKIIQSKSNFDFSWQTQKPISFSLDKKYYLQFYLYYNCWETKYFFQWLSTDCYNVVDKLTVFSKSSQDTDYKIIKEFTYNYIYSTNKWNKINIEFNPKSTEYNFKIKFERVKGADKGQAVIGLDEIKLVERKIVYDCDFNKYSLLSTGKYSACNGEINIFSNGQQTGVFQSIQVPSPLNYNITDVTSIESPTSNKKACVIPFNYISNSYYFCQFIINQFRCVTTDGTYGVCKLGSFWGVIADKPKNIFNMSFSMTNPIEIETKGNYDLEFKVYYNCNQESTWFSYGCDSVKDKLSVFMKLDSDAEFKLLRVFNFNRLNSSDSWVSYNVNFGLNETSNLKFKIDFNRDVGTDNGVAVFGFDDLKITTRIDETELPTQMIATSTISIIDTTTTNIVTSTSPLVTTTFSTSTTSTSAITITDEISTSSIIITDTTTTTNEPTFEETIETSTNLFNTNTDEISTSSIILTVSTTSIISTTTSSAITITSSTKTNSITDKISTSSIIITDTTTTTNEPTFEETIETSIDYTTTTPDTNIISSETIFNTESTTSTFQTLMSSEYAVTTNSSLSSTISTIFITTPPTTTTSFGASKSNHTSTNTSTTTTSLTETTTLSNIISDKSNTDIILISVLVPLGVVLVGALTFGGYSFFLKKKFTKIRDSDDLNDDEWELK